MTTTAATALVILLHGVGSNGADLEPLGHFWQGALPGAVFVSPDAPHRFDQAPTGFQWFSIGSITAADRAARIAAARADFDALVDRIVTGQGFRDRLDRVALVGFSQGSMMLLDGIARGRWPVAAGVAFSGRLGTADPLTPAHLTSLLLIHGLADPVVPAEESRLAAERLAAAGVDVEARFEPGLGHTISQAGAMEAGRFLADRLGFGSA